MFIAGTSQLLNIIMGLWHVILYSVASARTIQAKLPLLPFLESSQSLGSAITNERPRGDVVKEARSKIRVEA